MKTGVTILLVSLLVLSALFTAGCTSASSPKAAIVPGTTNPSNTQAPAPPATIPAVSPSPVTTTAVTATPAGTVPIPPAPATTPGSGYFSTADIPDNPWMENLEFSKSYYPFTVPDCVMKALIPETAAGYGIRQTVPALIALSPDRMDAFLQAYPENGVAPVGSTACTAGPASPNWNFIRITGTILPRNARPSEYDIGIGVSSRGRVIAEFRFNETLTLEQQVTFVRYVPLRSDEMDLFDSIGLNFYKKT